MQHIALPLIIFIEISLLCISYIPNVDIVGIQILLYSIIFVGYMIAPKRVSFLSKDIKKLYIFAVIFIFWLFGRIVTDLEISLLSQSIYNNNSSIYFFFFNLIIFPIIFLPFIKTSFLNIKYVLILSSILLLVCLAISLSCILTANAILSVDGRFSANEHLGTIEYGHLGVTIAILGFAFYQNENKSSCIKIYSLIIIILGIISFLLAGTRSAFVSFFACVLFYLFSSRKFSVFIVLIFIIAFLVIFKEEILSIFTELGSNSASRIYNLFTQGGDQTSGRTLLYNKALEDFLNNIFLGKAYIFQYNNQPYVHNSILEIARALGLIGIGLFLWINLKALQIAYFILRSKKEYTFFSLLFIQYFVFSLFSNTVIRLGMYWFSIAFLIWVKNNSNINLCNTTKECCPKN